MKILFDLHTVVAQEYSGKYNNMIRFAECLSRDPSISVKAVLDRHEGATEYVQQKYLRTKQNIKPPMSFMTLGTRWLNYQRQTEYDWLYTEVVLGGQWWPMFLSDKEHTVLHIDFQRETLALLPKTMLNLMKECSQFHVLTHVQKQVLVKLGFPAERIHVIPNCLDITWFEPTLAWFEPEQPYAIYVHGANSDWRQLPKLLSMTNLHLVTIGLHEALPGATQMSGVPTGLYVGLVQRATLAICLTPSGDSTTTRLFEFAAAGCPFVTPHSDAMEELIPCGIYKVSPHAVQWVQQNRDALSQEMKDVAQRYSYEATLPKLKELYT